MSFRQNGVGVQKGPEVAQREVIRDTQTVMDFRDLGGSRSVLPDVRAHSPEVLRVTVPTLELPGLDQRPPSSFPTPSVSLRKGERCLP